MNCRELSDFLFDYVNGDLPASMAASFQRHLDKCADCQAYVASYRQTIEISKAVFLAPDQNASDGMPEELVQAILSARNTV